MDENKVMTNEFAPEGEYGDIIEAADRVRDIVSTASKLTNDEAKKALLDGVKIIFKDCITAIENREKVTENIVMEDDD